LDRRCIGKDIWQAMQTATLDINNLPSWGLCHAGHRARFAGHHPQSAETGLIANVKILILPLFRQ
jgi:hypothetical protein